MMRNSEMLSLRQGDMFESNAQTLVNTVNCVGVMGKGIALQFKKHYPDMHKDYVQRCEEGKVKLGRPYIYKSLVMPWIINFPTKDHWRSVSKISDLEEGMKYLLEKYKEWGITSLAVPPLGSGYGQLEWKVVGRILYHYLKKMDIPVDLYTPFGIPLEQMQVEFLSEGILNTSNRNELNYKESIKPGWFILVEILHRIEKEPYHWPVGRTSFQKIAYVSTLLDIPTQLSFEQRSYGPFAPEMKSVLSKLADNGLIREERLGNMFEVKVGSTFSDSRNSYINEIAKWEDEIERITDLFLRIKTKQSELIATVLYTANELSKTSQSISEDDIYNYILNWKKKRRPKLDEAGLGNTIQNLAALGWLKVEPRESKYISNEY